MSDDSKKTAQKLLRRAPKTHSAYWTPRVRKPTGSGLYGIQILYKGKRVRFPLETADKVTASDRARDRYLYLVANGWEATLRKFKEAERKTPKPATIGAWLAEVEATAGFRANTFTTYAQCLRQIAAGIGRIEEEPELDEHGKPVKDGEGRIVRRSRFDHRTGGQAAWLKKVEALPLSVLSANAVQRWKLAYIAKAGDAPDARKRAENSAASLLRCARSLFSKKARKFAAGELVLPDPLPFAELELPKRGNLTYKSKIDAPSLIVAAREELSGEPLKIFALAMVPGLRKREIDLLPWTRVDFTKAVIRIERTEHFSPKSEDASAEIDIDPEFMTLLKQWKVDATGPFVVESTSRAKRAMSRTEYRCEVHFKTLYAWLRKHGVSAQKPLHELRKELGAILASEQGIFAAQSVLRHAQISTTAAYYVDRKKKITAGLGRFLSPQ